MKKKFLIEPTKSEQKLIKKTVRSLILHFGSFRKTTTALKIDTATLTHWVSLNYYPSLDVAIYIEKKTKKTFLRYDFCPQYFRD